MSDSQYRFVLASKSPRRVELLKSLVSKFDISPSSIEEYIDLKAAPGENVCRLAREKALDTARRFPEHFVLGADTVVVLNGIIIGKPEDEADARRILKSLSGNTHQVVTGVALVLPQGEILEEICASKVVFKNLTEQDIADYSATGEPMDKAGAYAIQGLGSQLIESHEGSFTNIVGLPVETLEQMLIRANYFLA